MEFKKKLLYLFVVLVGFTSHYSYSQTNFNATQYSDVLQKSMFFYRAQESGELSSTNTINWRAAAATTDGSDNGVDLSGGWNDAGDNVKFNFPMAYSATVLAWSVIEFKPGYVKSGQYDALRNNLRYVCDYLMKCHTAPNELYGQVGNGNWDHTFWGATEVSEVALKTKGGHAVPRPSFKIDAAHPGTDLAMETASALAAASIVFADDSAYQAKLLSHAKQLYTFGDTYRGKYSDAITNVSAFYNSWSGYDDELIWGSIWLYKATNDATYLTKAENFYATGAVNEQGSTTKKYSGVISWDDKINGCEILLAKITGKEKYITDSERHLDYWLKGGGTSYTAGGLAYNPALTWAILRYSANAAFTALVYSDYITDPVKKAKYYEFAKGQIDYSLGNNPAKRSYVCGFGVNPPLNIHHRTASGVYDDSVLGNPVNNRHVLYGALVGGPGTNDVYVDGRDQYTYTEVATDYNAAFSGAVARLVQSTGSVSLPLPAVPVETVGEEYFTTAKSNSTGNNYSELSIKIHNHTAWPARIPEKLSYRYFLDISEGINAGFTSNDYTIVTNYFPDARLASPKLKLWSGTIYYFEVIYDSTAKPIYPGGQGESKRESQVRVAAPAGAPWNSANDFSYSGITGTDIQSQNIAVYENNKLVYGKEPSSSTVPSFTINATAAANGTITPAGATSVTSGTDQTFTITPSSGYQIATLTVDGVAKTVTASYTFSNVVANHSIAATFSILPVTSYTLVASAGTNGSISPVGTATVNSGSNKTYTITPNAGYKVATLLIDGTAVNAANTYTFSNVTSDHTIAATFSAVSVGTYTITATTGSNGTISPLGSTSVTSGSNKTYTITPNAGYKVATLVIDGTAVTPANTYIFSTITANHTIAVTFTIVSVSTYTITATAGANGTISPAGVKTVNSGSDQTYTITPNAGYQIDALKVNNTIVTTDNTYAFTNVTSNQTIAVTFKAVSTGGNCLLSTFSVPRNSGLPSKNTTFKYIYVLGNSGPNLASASLATFNWEAQYNGLYDFSMNFSNSPWYIGFAQTSSQKLNQANPSITINGSGIANFDNNTYYVNLINDDLVLVETSGSHAIYFSNSATRPVECSNTTKKASKAVASDEAEITIYPVPATDYLTVRLADGSGINTITVKDMNGHLISTNKTDANQEQLSTIDIKNLNEGIFLISIESNFGTQTKRFIKKN